MADVQADADANADPTPAKETPVAIPQAREATSLVVHIFGREYVESYPASPYVKDGKEVQILPGEVISLRGDVGADGRLRNLVVVPRAEGDVHLKLRHVEHPGRAPGTILTVEHDFDGYLRYCAAMRLVGEPDEDSTSTVGVRPKVASAEIWADPIAHLRLVDFELTTERRGCR